MGPLKFFSITFSDEITHTVVPCSDIGELTHTVVVMLGGGLLVNMGPLKLFSSSFLRGIDPHSGSVYVLFNIGGNLY